MRTIRTKVYTFNELVVDAQQNAIEANADINTDYNWWINVYEDSEMIGLKLTGFDLHQNNRVDGNFINSAYDCATNIVKNHGEDCKIHRISKAFINKWDEAVKLHSNGINTNMVADGQELYFDEYVGDYEDDFLKHILNCYGELLHSELEYRESEEAIRETIIANEYEFLKDGSKYTL